MNESELLRRRVMMVKMEDEWAKMVCHLPNCI